MGESAIEPLNEEDARMVEDQVGEENALKTKRQPRRPSEQEFAAHEAGGHYPCRDWCRACVGGAGRSDAHKRHSDEQNEIPVAAMHHAFFCDEYEERLSESETQSTEIPKGATPFLVIRVKPCMMTWSFPVRCKGLEDQTAIKEAVDLLNKLGYPELIMRTDGEPAIRVVRLAVARELKEQHGIRVIQQNTPKYDSASAGLVENAVKQVKEKVRVLVIGARELHGATIDRNHVTLPWCIRFAGQVLSRRVKGHDGLTAFQRAYQRKSHPRPLPAAWGEQVLYLEATKRKAQLSDKFEDGIFLGIKDGTEELIVGTPTGCKICRSVKRRSRADAADPVFFNSVRGTPWCLVPDDAVREPRMPTQFDVRPASVELPPRIVTADHSGPRRVYIRAAVELARYGYTPNCAGCEAAEAGVPG